MTHITHQELAELLESDSAPMAVESLATVLFRWFEPEFATFVEKAQADFLPIRPDDVEAIRTPEAYVAAHAPAYTTNLDEALALVRKRLPAHPACVDQWATEVRLQIGQERTTATLDRDTFSGDCVFIGQAVTPALAVCAAMVRAHAAGPDKAVQDDGGNGG